jgi:hypothetical protein
VPSKRVSTSELSISVKRSDRLRGLFIKLADHIRTVRYKFLVKACSRSSASMSSWCSKPLLPCNLFG